ncbi:MAG: PaaI family thioesterase [Planctomycetaceae bacterium]|nr:PaaI family thioesterase [Planctomycetaceae bacterium]
MQDPTYQQLRAEHHPNCVVCSPESPNGLRLVFHIADDRSVEASFSCDQAFQGYPSTIHGGVVSAMLDGAMTNCLLAHGLVAVTFELNIRFRHPVATARPAVVRARLVASSQPIHELAAELLQDGQLKATAKAKFLERSAVAWAGNGNS